jgi:chorismate dehydratase
MAPNSPDTPLHPLPEVRTLGVVSFLNARPLWRTLARREGLAIRPTVPSRLAGMLANARCDVAMIPVVDHWMARRRLVRVSDACIACDGETMTVRVFSRVPPQDIQRLHVDADSHTSVVLAKTIWREMHGRRLEIIQQPSGETPDDVEALLLIGDKVITAAPSGFAYQTDLGAAWKELTGLPFVFAAWYGKRDHNHGTLARILEEARDVGVTMIDQIAAEEAPRHGWPRETALKYLRDHMRYTITPAMRAGMDRFFTLVHEHDLLE